MRAIQKQGNGGFHLNQSHGNPPVNAVQATSRWKSFGYKPTVQSQLLYEQYQLCCYSELRADQEGVGYHIEHIENKSQAPGRTFDYTNLAASALHSDDLAKIDPGDTFGGHAAAKQATCNMALFVSCHQVDCRRFFAYLSDGRIVPSKGLVGVETARAQYTIDQLNLNSPYLVNRRRHWWDELAELFVEHEAKGWSLRDLAAIDLVPTNGALSRFFSLTRQLFEGVAEDVLQNQAPQLV